MRFSDTGLAGEQHDLAFASRCPRPSAEQQFVFFLAADQGAHPAWVQRLEAACHGIRPQHRPDPHWPVMPLKSLRPEVLELEEIAQKPSRAFADDDHVRLGDALEAGREVRRLADDAAVLRLPAGSCPTTTTGRDADPELVENARS